MQNSDFLESINKYIGITASFMALVSGIISCIQFKWELEDRKRNRDSRKAVPSLSNDKPLIGSSSSSSESKNVHISSTPSAVKPNKAKGSESASKLTVTKQLEPSVAVSVVAPNVETPRLSFSYKVSIAATLFFAFIVVASLVGSCIDRPVEVSLEQPPVALAKTDLASGEFLLKTDTQWIKAQINEPLQHIRELGINTSYSSRQHDSRCQEYIGDHSIYFYVKNGRVVAAFDLMGYLAAGGAYRGQSVSELFSKIGKPSKAYKVTTRFLDFDTLYMFTRGEQRLYVFAVNGRVDSIAIESSIVRDVLFSQYEFGLQRLLVTDE